VGKKGFNMNHHATKDENNTPQLRVADTEESAPFDEAQTDLQEVRKHLREQAEAEEFWAGRNLAGRIPTRRAA
jgi:hypothetical protein